MCFFVRKEIKVAYFVTIQVIQYTLWKIYFGTIYFPNGTTTLNIVYLPTIEYFHGMQNCILVSSMEIIINV